MKLLGLIGGMSWENTIEYYRIANELANSRLGGWNSAKILLYSVNFADIFSLQDKQKWDQIAKLMLDICKKLEKVGSSAIVICSNTMHKIADNIEQEISIPLIHVVDETAKIIVSKNINTIGLLGTKFTMEDGFYKDRLEKKFSLKVILPNKVEIKYINKAIYNEFAKGNFSSSTKQKFLKIIDNLLNVGAQGIILGCTEIPLLIKPEDVEIPLFDTLKIHLRAAINFVLS